MKFSEIEVEDFWNFVEIADWKLDHDYDRIQSLLDDVYPRQKDTFDNIYRSIYSELYVRFEDNWLKSPGISASDDSWSDLLADVIGRGKDFYDNINVETLTTMADNTDYMESFSYSFH